MGTRVFAHAYGFVLDLSSSTAPPHTPLSLSLSLSLCFSLSLPLSLTLSLSLFLSLSLSVSLSLSLSLFLSLSLSLRGTEGGDAPAGCVFPAAGLVYREKDEEGSVNRSVHSAWFFPTLTFIIPGAPKPFLELYFNFLPPRRQTEKPADETWLTTDLDLTRVMWKWVPLLGLTRATPPFSGPTGTKDAAGSARTCALGSSYPALRCPQRDSSRIGHRQPDRWITTPLYNVRQHRGTHAGSPTPAALCSALPGRHNPAQMFKVWCHFLWKLLLVSLDDFKTCRAILHLHLCCYKIQHHSTISLFWVNKYSSFRVFGARWLAYEEPLTAERNRWMCVCMFAVRVRARANVCASVVWHKNDIWCSAIHPPPLPCKPQSSCYDSFVQGSAHMHTRTHARTDAHTPVKFSSLRYGGLLHYLPHNLAVSVMLVMTKACYPSC